MAGLSTIEVRHRFKPAPYGDDDAPTNPLARALRPLLDWSKQLPVIRPVLFVESGSEYRWLGIFVLSPGGRVLFFPGLAHLQGSFRSTNFNGAPLYNQAFDLDHLSLEADRKTWHLTSPASKRHLHGSDSLDLGEHRFLWVGMCANDIERFARAKRDTVATGQVKPKGAERKRKQIQEAVEEGGTVVFRIPPKPERPNASPFISIVVGQKGFKEYEGPEWGAPTPSEGTPADTTYTLTCMRFSMGEQVEIQLAFTWLDVALSAPVVFTSPRSET